MKFLAIAAIAAGRNPPGMQEKCVIKGQPPLLVSRMKCYAAQAAFFYLYHHNSITQVALTPRDITSKWCSINERRFMDNLGSSSIRARANLSASLPSPSPIKNSDTAGLLLFVAAYFKVSANSSSRSRVSASIFD